MSYYTSSLMLLRIIVVLCWAIIPLIKGDDTTPSESPLVIASHCTNRCGSVSIPYPFGIEEDCYFIEENQNYSSFKVHCDHNTRSPTPYFGNDLDILNISVSESELRSTFDISYRCFNQTGYSHWSDYSLNLASFTFSSTKNVLVAIGCDTYAWFSGMRDEKNYSTGCMTSCAQLADVTDGECSGVGCCQTSIPSGVKNIFVEARSINDHKLVDGFNPCSIAYTVAKDAFKFNKSDLSLRLVDLNRTSKAIGFPVVFDWLIGSKSCSVAKADGSCLCKENAECEDQESKLGYRCKCKPGFSGNPYLPHGCKDIDECKNGNNCQKPEYCTNTIGGYECRCPKGFRGNGTASDRCISNAKPWLVPVLATAGIGGSIIILLLVGFFLHWKHGERKLQKMRDTFFQQNGGLILHDKISSRRGDTLKIFTAQDLEKASNNYCDENIIGRGGFGIVYKGILPDNQVVAIKKSLKVDPNQVEQFINEVLVLSQIKNKYVVKLLGCCLESEVPLLVYEFINNGTLFEHLNDGVKASYLKWHMRLKIASQVANVLSYLHYSISTPIVHRDMKSMNILLDESYTAKVTDFGASRLIPPDQSQFATLVLGTRGYLDPEYMQTSELTEKSDVYSFGVVLVELLTRQKAISNLRPENEKCLAMHFLLKMKEGRLFNILDRYIVSEGTMEDIQQVANLAKWCLRLKGEERPTMKEVAMELEGIKRKGVHPWNDDGSMQEDRESFLDGVPRSGDCSCNSGIELTSYDSQFLSSLGGGR